MKYTTLFQRWFYIAPCRNVVSTKREGWNNVVIFAKFNKFDNAFSLLDKLRDGKISLADAKKKDQAESKSNLSEIKKGNKKHRSEEQKNTLYNVERLYKARNIVIEFFDDYSLVVSETKLKQLKELGWKL